MKNNKDNGAHSFTEAANFEENTSDSNLIKLITLNEAVEHEPTMYIDKVARFSLSLGACAKMEIQNESELRFFFDSSDFKNIYIKVVDKGDVVVKRHTMRVNKKTGLQYKYSYFRSTEIRRIIMKAYHCDKITFKIGDRIKMGNQFFFPLVFEK